MFLYLAYIEAKPYNSIAYIKYEHIFVYISIYRGY